MGLLDGDGSSTWLVFANSSASNLSEKVVLQEGAASIGVGIIAFFIMSPTIEKARWLTAAEKAALIESLELSGRYVENQGQFSWREVFAFFKSPFAVITLLNYFSNGLILFGMAFL